MVGWWVVVVTGEKMITIWGEGFKEKRGGRDVWHGKGLEADTHSMDAVQRGDDDDAT